MALDLCRSCCVCFKLNKVVICFTHMLNFVCKAFFAPLFYFANCSAVTGYITFGFLNYSCAFLFFKFCIHNQCFSTS